MLTPGGEDAGRGTAESVAWARGAPARDRRSPAGVALATLAMLAVALRLAVVVAPPASLDGPRGQGFPEELWRGVAAQELIDGPLMPLFEYQVNAFSGGSLVYAVLTVPPFLVLGPTMVAMRLPTILFGVLAALCAFLALDHSVGRRAAWSAGLLLALVPPGYAAVSSIAWGTHLEGNALAMLLLWLYLRAHERRSTGASFLLGLAAGFSVYFGYVALLVLAAMLGADLLFERRRPGMRERAWRLAGFGLGFAPWIAYNLQTGFAGLSEIYGKSALEHLSASGAGADSGSRAAGGAWAKVAELFQEGFPTVVSMPAALGLGDRTWSIVLALSLAGLALAGIIAQLARRAGGTGAHPVRVAMLYLPLFLLAYTLTDFRIDPARVERCRYAMPVYPWVVVAAAGGVDVLSKRGAPRVALALAVVIAASFGAGTLARCRPERAAEIRAAPAAPVTILARTVFSKGPTDRERIGPLLERLLAKRPEETRHQFLFVLGQNYKAVVRRTEGDPERGPEARSGRRPTRAEHADMLDWIRERVPAEYQPYFEQPRAGDGSYAPFTPRDRERFWRRYRERAAEGG